MDGRMGACPDWYYLLQTAKYLGVAPWELIEQSVVWQDIALIAMMAESEAAEIKARHK